MAVVEGWGPRDGFGEEAHGNFFWKCSVSYVGWQFQGNLFYCSSFLTCICITHIHWTCKYSVKKRELMVAGQGEAGSLQKVLCSRDSGYGFALFLV